MMGGQYGFAAIKLVGEDPGRECGNRTNSWLVPGTSRLHGKVTRGSFSRYGPHSSWSKCMYVWGEECEA